MVELMEDIYSVLKGRELYGRRGEKVKVISDMGDILIVEGRTRFPVLKTKVKPYIFFTLPVKEKFTKH